VSQQATRYSIEMRGTALSLSLSLSLFFSVDSAKKNDGCGRRTLFDVFDLDKLKPGLASQEAPLRQGIRNTVKFIHIPCFVMHGNDALRLAVPSVPDEWLMLQHDNNIEVQNTYRGISCPYSLTPSYQLGDMQERGNEMGGCQ
jgi:hypothetical protein